MKILGKIRCLLAPHAPNRKKVRKHEDGGYIGVCQHCGVKLKQIKRNHWVRDWRKRQPQSRTAKYEQEDDFNG